MKSLFKTALLTGLFVGTTDLISAYITQWIKTGRFAGKMLNYIGGGVLGLETSMQGGNAAAFVGLCTHYLISLAYTFFFFLIFPKLRWLAYNKYLIGMLYAVFVNLTVNQGLIRLSRLPDFTFDLAEAYVSWVILGVIFGIPIVVSAYKYYQAEAR